MNFHFCGYFIELSFCFSEKEEGDDGGPNNQGPNLQEVEMAGRDKVAEEEEGGLVGQDLVVVAVVEGLVVVSDI